MYSVGIVIPCYNEAERLCCAEFSEFLSGSDVHLTFVNDGSRDKTLEVLMSLKRNFPLQVQVINLRSNRGKAEAVRTGMLTIAHQGFCDIVGFMDADLSTPLNEIGAFLQAFRSRGVECVFGSRISRIGSEIRRSPYRHFSGRVIASFISTYLRIPIYDSQCGAKFFSHNLATEIFRDPFVSRWLFDVELFKRIELVRKKLDGCCLELPLNRWIEKGNSKLSFSQVIRLPLEAWSIVRHYKKIRPATAGPSPIATEFVRYATLIKELAGLVK